MLCFELSGCAIYGVAPCAGARIEMVMARVTPMPKRVAPCAGARIEIGDVTVDFAKMQCRTLRGCANRNRVRTAYPKGRKASHLTRVRESKRTNLHTGKDAPGRTLRGHANQNNAFFFLAAAGIRRTHAGARIEIVTLAPKSSYT